MSEKTPLSSSSPQFAYLEYFLQLCLHASSARLLTVHALSNPHNTVQFERRCRDILTLDTWVDPAHFPPGNAEEEVVRRGFVFSANAPGIRVGIGAIRSAQQDETKTVHKAILCKVGIGRAYLNDPDNAAREPIPEGYDSYYLPVDREDADGNHNDYYHEYFISNAAQVLPMYLVQYEYDPVKERRIREKPQCDNCESALADFYCAADSANLCKKCDTQLHSANKLVSRHIRTPIGKGMDVFGHCRHHPDKLFEFFCSQCHVPVCVHCKMVGHHSSGEAAKHKLVSVAEAYQTVMSDAQVPDNILASRKQAIDNQLASLSARAKSLDKHAAAIQQQIEDIYKRAMAELKTITKRKIDVLASDECELRRQAGEIARLEQFLTYQQSGDATHFLFSWARHQQLRQELHDFKFFRDSIDVQLDIKCSGGINVLVDSDRGATSGSSAPGSPAKRYLAPSVKSRAGGGGADDASTITRSTRGSVTGSPNKLAPGTRGGMAAATNGSPRRAPVDFFSEALGALDEISTTGAAGTAEYASEFSFGEGEGYISD
ncbi:hypothetical protein GGF31_003168 [Allomyces arbusculus]|nr:hypothetical protein GGF31_003168 [Allomyces arbusculus]